MLVCDNNTIRHGLNVECQATDIPYYKSDLLFIHGKNAIVIRSPFCLQVPRLAFRPGLYATLLTMRTSQVSCGCCQRPQVRMASNKAQGIILPLVLCYRCSTLPGVQRVRTLTAKARWRMKTEAVESYTTVPGTERTGDCQPQRERPAKSQTPLVE